jgi:pimeloyl-ACP methyl ester carboxylesterase
LTKASTVILVHGAWADGSSWSKVIPILRKEKLQVRSVQLPLMSMEADVATVKRTLSQIEGPTILVGHSYGGVIITEAGNDPKVAGLVYIAAFAPDAGESAGSLGASVDPAPLGAEVRPDKEEFLTLTETGVKSNFAQDLSEEEKDLLYVAQAPTAAAALGGSVRQPAWKTKPSWYLVATADRAIQPELQRTMARRIKATTVEVAASHVAMLARPEETANLVLDAASLCFADRSIGRK